MKLCNFSKAPGIIEKAEGIDASAIALAGERLNIQPSEGGLNIAAVRLRENIQLRNSFIDEKVRFENQLRRLVDSEVPKILKSHAELPELGEISRTEISKLAGLAPMAKESGKITCRRHIRGGRRNARCAFYMATLTAFSRTVNSLYFFSVIILP